MPDAQYAELEEHLDLLKGNGITVDNLRSVTNEGLEKIGVTKFMHQKRFARYAADMRRKTDQDLTKAEKKKAWDDNKKKFDEKRKAGQKGTKGSEHNFKMKCTEAGRKMGACQ